MEKLSVTIITLNEESNIRRCMESVLSIADEIIVIDSGSTDRTGEIVEELGGSFTYNKWPGFRDQKNFAVEKAKNNWIFSIDADEWIGEDLSIEIRDLLTSEPGCGAYEVDRKTMFLGEFVKVWSPDWIIRLFNRENGLFGGGNIHESVKLKEGASCDRLKAQLFHETDKDLAGYFFRTCQYTSIAAQGLYSKGEKVRYSKLLLSLVWGFLKRLLLKGGWRDGYRGLIISFTRSFYTFMQYTKLWDLYRKGGLQKETEVKDSRDSVD